MIVFALVLTGLVVFVALDSTDNETDIPLAPVEIAMPSRAPRLASRILSEKQTVT